MFSRDIVLTNEIFWAYNQILVLNHEYAINIDYTFTNNLTLENICITSTVQRVYRSSIGLYISMAQRYNRCNLPVNEGCDSHRHVYILYRMLIYM